MFPVKTHLPGQTKKKVLVELLALYRIWRKQLAQHHQRFLAFCQSNDQTNSFVVFKETGSTRLLPIKFIGNPYI